MLGFGIDQKGKASIKGPLVLEPLSAKLTVNLITLQVKTLQPYFADNFTDNIRNIEGTNTILMTGFANTLRGIHGLILEIDHESGERVELVAFELGSPDER